MYIIQAAKMTFSWKHMTSSRKIYTRIYLGYAPWQSCVVQKRPVRSSRAASTAAALSGAASSAFPSAFNRNIADRAITMSSKIRAADAFCLILSFIRFSFCITSKALAFNNVRKTAPHIRDPAYFFIHSVLLRAILLYSL